MSLFRYISYHHSCIILHMFLFSPACSVHENVRNVSFLHVSSQSWDNFPPQTRCDWSIHAMVGSKGVLRQQCFFCYDFQVTLVCKHQRGSKFVEKPKKSIYIYIYMYIYMYIYIYICIYIYVLVYICIYICISVYVYIYTVYDHCEMGWKATSSRIWGDEHPQ